MSPVAALALVLGANLGSAINPLLESGANANPASRRLPFGNLINRLVGVVLVLPFLQPIAGLLMRLDSNPIRMAADFHTAFNVLLALVFIFLLDGLASVLTRLLPDLRNGPIRPRRFTSTKRRFVCRLWRWLARRARRCTWGMSSRAC